MRSVLLLCVCAIALTPAALARSSAPEVGRPAAQSIPAALKGDGMWIWIANRSHGGSPAAIARRAKASGIETIFLKSGDGTSMWSQFSPGFVSALKQRGLKVCAWHYVYGRNPSAEAAVLARAKSNGADCFIIDAEAEYEGKYRAARTYMKRLRALVGPDYPIGLAAFPYVHFHPSFPYSVFLGPGGAQFNLPQMYWKAIGVSVNTIYFNTIVYNRPYGRAVLPLGQTYMNVSPAEIDKFRALGAANGANGVSWWDWQSSKSRHWNALSKPLSDVRSNTAPVKGWPLLKKGAKGDLVLWAQQHLISAGEETPATGVFRDQTAKAVASFRAKHGLPAGTTVDAGTWPELLKFKPKASKAAASSTGEPESASLPSVRREIPPKRH